MQVRRAAGPCVTTEPDATSGLYLVTFGNQCPTQMTIRRGIIAVVQNLDICSATLGLVADITDHAGGGGEYIRAHCRTQINTVVRFIHMLGRMIARG